MALIGGVRKNKSGHRGVVRFERRRGKVKFVAQISIEGHTKFLGSFDSASEAARRYDTAAKELWGPHARLNFTDEPPAGA